MKKLLTAMLLALALLCSTTALAAFNADSAYVVPDPEHFFGESMEETSAYNYAMYFEEDPRDMFDAYISLLQSNYGMETLAISNDSLIVTYPDVNDSGLTIEYAAGEEGYRIDVCVHRLVELKKLEQYEPQQDDAQDEIMLPHPGYYFGRTLSENIIEFEEYPQAEYAAYVSLLQGAYGMEIVEEEAAERYELVYLEAPGNENSRTLVACFTNSKGSGMEFSFGEGVTLSALDVYEQPADHAEGDIAWDDGRMIADPGDFLGYEIECIEYQDKTAASTKGYCFYKYEAIPTEDILAFADALNASPYFYRNSKGVQGKYYWMFCYDYTGSDAELMEVCAEGRAEIGDYHRKGDLSIYICSPYASESEFYLHEYPGFTVNTDTSTIKENDYVPSDGEERCIFCNNGSCKTCGGSGQVYQWIPGEDDQRRIDCTSCMNGRCTVCGGDGWK